MINYMENVFNAAYSYVSSFLWQAANLLGISLETLIYSIAAAVVIGIFFMKRSAKENASPIDFNKNKPKNENYIEDDSIEWMNKFTFDPSYHNLSGNIYHDE